MAITRGQMRRQLYGLGSLVGREKFGLGSKLKRFVRKIIPNEVAEVAVKAAPFVAPFNAPLAGAMSALGTFDQTGRIGQSVKSGLINYGLGRISSGIMGGGYQTGKTFNPFSSEFYTQFTSPIGTQSGIGKMLADKGYIQTETFTPSGDIGLASEGSIQGASAVDPSKAYLPTDFASEALPLEQVTTGVTTGAQKATTPGYKELFSKLVSPDATLAERTTAIKDLGGKALKSAYTNPVRDSSGKIIDYEVDKLAIGATIAGGATYLDAKRLAKEAELVDNEDEYTEEMYEADKARYKDYYSKILTPAAFGLKDGGLISLRKMKSNGTDKEDLVYMTDDNSGVIYMDPDGNRITKEEFFRRTDEAEKESNTIMPMRKPDSMKESKLDKLNKLKGILDTETYERLLEEFKESSSGSGIPSITLKKKDDEDEVFMQEGYNLEKKAQGGRIGFENGSGKIDTMGDMSEEDMIMFRNMKNTLIEKILRDRPGSASNIFEALNPFDDKDVDKRGGAFRREEYSKELNDLINNMIATKDKPEERSLFLEKFERKYKADGGRIGFKDGPGKGGLEDFKIGDYKPFKYTGSIDDMFEADLGDDPLAGIVKIGYAVRAPLIDVIRGVAKTGKEAASLIAAATKAGYDLTKPVREAIGDVAGGIYDVAKKTVQESGDASRFIQPLYYLERFGGDKTLTDDETRLRRLKRSIGRDDRDLIKTIENRIFGYDDAGINQSEEDKKVSKQIQADIDSRDFGFKKGGRIGYMMGSEVPMRKNEGGITELDYRNTGGFVPIGIKEKADDVPAMLSKNEFVFTADAVRAAGGGSVNKGAQRMYNLMKSLESKVV